jgi:hypothetical protein
MTALLKSPAAGREKEAVSRGHIVLVILLVHKLCQINATSLSLFSSNGHFFFSAFGFDTL